MVDIKDNIELVDIDKLYPYHNNPKEHPAEQIDKICSSIKHYGFTVPLIIDADNEIIAGHGRYKAAQKLGMDELPCIRRKDLTEEQAKAFRLADNKVAESEWDMEMLEVEFEAIEDEFTGFELDELDFQTEEVEEDDFTEEVDEEAEPITELGDVIELGRHRLVCGDSTSEEDVSKLMNGEKADMVFTDPPYGVNYKGGHFHSGDVNIKREREELVNDKKAIYKDVIPVIAKYTDGPCYTWFAGSKGKDIYNSINKIGEIHALIIWHKTNATYAAMNAQYKQRHEPCIYWKPKGSTLRWTGPTDECTIWEMKTDGRNKYHPTQKPISLAGRAINNHDVNIVLDLFGGSGSTLIAAEQLDRNCYMMELDEHYCDVIIRRYINYKQDKGENINIKLNGESIDYSRYIE